MLALIGALATGNSTTVTPPTPTPLLYLDSEASGGITYLSAVTSSGITYLNGATA